MDKYQEQQDEYVLLLVVRSAMSFVFFEGSYSGGAA